MPVLNSILLKEELSVENVDQALSAPYTSCDSKREPLRYLFLLYPEESGIAPACWPQGAVCLCFV